MKEISFFPFIQHLYFCISNKASVFLSELTLKILLLV